MSPNSCFARRHLLVHVLPCGTPRARKTSPNHYIIWLVCSKEFLDSGFDASLTGWTVQVVLFCTLITLHPNAAFLDMSPSFDLWASGSASGSPELYSSFDSPSPERAMAAFRVGARRLIAMSLTALFHLSALVKGFVKISAACKTVGPCTNLNHFRLNCSASQDKLTL